MIWQRCICFIVLHAIWLANGGFAISDQALHTRCQPTHAGYASISYELGSKLFYAYYESSDISINGDTDRVPILLWLQGGPGCASTFGGFYELGPCSVRSDGSLVPNPGSWAQKYGLLLVDQPIGTGYSLVGNDTIPADEIGMATQLYKGIQQFFVQHPEYQHRPFFITGESYGGKYVPSLAHYILQLQPKPCPPHSNSNQGRRCPRLRHHRPLPAGQAAPAFNLQGIAIGNGLTSPRAQTAVMADVAYHMGLVPEAGRRALSAQQDKVVGLIDAGDWAAAHDERSTLLEMVANMTGVATLLDARRTRDYDAGGAVDALLNSPQMKSVMNASSNVQYASCSETIGRAMGADVMISVAHLIPDILARLPVLLYQGQFDLQDGPASNEAWMASLEWPGQVEFNALHSSLLKLDGVVVGWKRELQPLTHIVIRNAGHMVPHDQPEATLFALQSWVANALAYTRARPDGQVK